MYKSIFRIIYIYDWFCCTRSQIIITQETPHPNMSVKRFGCTAIHNKALHKCIIPSFIQISYCKTDFLLEMISEVEKVI